MSSSPQCEPESPTRSVRRDVDPAATVAPVTSTAAIRSTLHDLLSSGRAVSTAELRIRIHDSGFGNTPHESVYQQLVLLAGRGLVRKLGPRNGRRHTFWAASHPSPDATPTGMTVRALGHVISPSAEGVDSVR